jgi:glucans biosynthesis protein
VPAREDYRPEVHDSDGLQIETGTGEWLWRPLDNPRTLRVSDFSAENPRGFGLIQRDRLFDHFQDLETHPELRPSVWVTPKGGNVWQKGRVELVEIPTERDINDNVAAFWIPEGLPPPTEPLEVAYQMSWYGKDPAGRPPGGRVTDTRRDRDGMEGAVRFVIDFDGGELRDLPPETILRGVITVASGEGDIVDQQVMKNTGTGGWRFVFQLRPKSDPIELRAFLDHGGRALTETWSYRLEP